MPSAQRWRMGVGGRAARALPVPFVPGFDLSDGRACGALRAAVRVACDIVSPPKHGVGWPACGARAGAVSAAAHPKVPSCSPPRAPRARQGRPPGDVARILGRVQAVRVTGGARSRHSAVRRQHSGCTRVSFSRKSQPFHEVARGAQQRPHPRSARAPFPPHPPKRAHGAPLGRSRGARTRGARTTRAPAREVQQCSAAAATWEALPPAPARPRTPPETRPAGIPRRGPWPAARARGCARGAQRSGRHAET